MSAQALLPDSTVQGPLIVTNVNGDLNDAALDDFFQQLIVGVVGISGTLVRPRWQPEPPNQPDFGTDWAAIGVTERNRDVFAFEGRGAVTEFGKGQFGAGGYGGRGHCVIRQQVLTVLLSFYGPNAGANTEAFAMGMGLAQNREVFTVNNMGLVEVSASSPTVPELINKRWVQRIDTPFRVRRSQKYTYTVVDVSIAGIVVYLDGPKAAYEIDTGKEVYGSVPYGSGPFGGGVK